MQAQLGPVLSSDRLRGRSAALRSAARAGEPMSRPWDPVPESQGRQPPRRAKGAYFPGVIFIDIVESPSSSASPTWWPTRPRRRHCVGDACPGPFFWAVRARTAAAALLDSGESQQSPLAATRAHAT